MKHVKDILLNKPIAMKKKKKESKSHKKEIIIIMKINISK